jgi:hypothetical protein
MIDVGEGSFDHLATEAQAKLAVADLARVNRGQARP